MNKPMLFQVIDGRLHSFHFGRSGGVKDLRPVKLVDYYLRHYKEITMEIPGSLGGVKIEVKISRREESTVNEEGKTYAKVDYFGTLAGVAGEFLISTTMTEITPPEVILARQQAYAETLRKNTEYAEMARQKVAGITREDLLAYFQGKQRNRLRRKESRRNEAIYAICKAWSDAQKTAVTGELLNRAAEVL
jgi:hypothetical protein